MAAVFDYKVIQYLVEALVETDGNAIVTQLLLEYIWDIAGTKRDAQMTQFVLEYLWDVIHRDAQCTQLVIEVMIKNNKKNVYLDEMGNCDLSF